MMQAAVGALVLFPAAIFGIIFLFLRHRHRQRKRAGLEPGFYPATRDLGNAFHTLQILARPSITHVMQQKLEEPEEPSDNGDGGPDNRPPHKRKK